MHRIISLIKVHKILSCLGIIIFFGSGYYGYTRYTANGGETHYILAIVEKGMLIVSISGSGQVSSSNQVDVKPKASGEITALYAKLGQEVGVGAILAAIDASDAERSVRDAETSLETAKLELDKLLDPLDELTLLQAENSLIQTKESKKKSEDNLKKAHEDGFNTVANVFLELPGIMIGLHDILFESTFIGSGQSNISYYADSVKMYDEKALQYKEDTNIAYQKALMAYDKNFADYKSTSRFADNNTIEMLIGKTYDTTKDIAEAIKNVNNLIQFYQDKLTEQNLKPNPLSNTHLSSLVTYTGKTNSSLSTLLSIDRTIQDSKDAIISAGRSIEEKELSLVKTKKGPDDLDIRAKKIVIQQKEDALTTAKQALADHYVRAPFTGVIAKVSVKKGDTASAGTLIATLVTKQKIAEVSLNEIDVARIKTGQKTTLTFDAIPDLTITGQVAEVDAVGIVSQGVVTYTVKIGFDTQDDRVKTAMSISAAIVIEAKPNVLLVPNSAVKSQNNAQYAEMAEGEDINVNSAVNGTGVILKNTPRRQTIETGLSNDEFIEIISGLKEGDHVVARTIQPGTGTTQTQTQQQLSGLRIPGLSGGGGGGGGFRGGGASPANR